MKTFILLSAIPGSGKSTWAKNYQKQHPNTYIVASDDVRARVAGSMVNFEHEPEVWKTFLEDIHAYGEIEDVTVIADSTNLKNEYRRYYLQQTPEFDVHKLVYFHIPFDICKIQNKMREKQRIVSDSGMESLISEFEEPTQDVIDLYDEFIVIEKSYVNK